MLPIQDVQHKIREAFRGIPDEFMTCNLASTAKVFAVCKKYVKYKTAVDSTFVHILFENHNFLIVKDKLTKSEDGLVYADYLWKQQEKCLRLLELF